MKRGLKAAHAAVLGAFAVVGAEGAFAVGVLEGAAATQRSTIADVSDLTIRTDFEEVRVFAADRRDVEAELSVSARMSRRNRPELAVDRVGTAVTLRVGGNDLPISRASVEWGPKLTLSVPAGVELTVRTGSGAVVVQGLRSDRLEVFTAKGDVFVGDCAGPLLVAGGSGSVRVARCDGELRLSSTSGAIEVADARGAVIAHTESGSQRFHRIEGDLTVLRGTELEVSAHRGRLIVEERP